MSSIVTGATVSSRPVSKACRPARPDTRAANRIRLPHRYANLADIVGSIEAPKMICASESTARLIISAASFTSYIAISDRR